VNVSVDFNRCFVCISGGSSDYRRDLMHYTLYRRVAETAIWVDYTEQTVSRAINVTTNCFSAEAAIDQIMYFNILCRDKVLRLKRNLPQQ
jgi:hypothetical protein